MIRKNDGIRELSNSIRKLSLIKEILDSEKLPHSQSKGILTLLYKKGEREDIKNWRPLTLLNVDYKIVSKLLANRIKPKLCKLIHPDQRGFVPGRSIHEANRLIQDIIDYANMRNDNGSIIFLDQEKAFDRVEWEWLDTCLIKYNFGNKFRSWVNMLLKDAKTCIKTNGHISNYFKITRSARQGLSYITSFIHTTNWTVSLYFTQRQGSKRYNITK